MAWAFNRLAVFSVSSVSLLGMENVVRLSGLNEVAANVLTDLGHVQFRQADNELRGLPFVFMPAWSAASPLKTVQSTTYRGWSKSL